jgi:hypothetical protein
LPHPAGRPLTFVRSNRNPLLTLGDVGSSRVCRGLFQRESRRCSCQLTVAAEGRIPLSLSICYCLEAEAVERAVGPCYHDGPHAAGGLQALPHWQQRSPPPQGHSFYETHMRKAIP